MRPDPIAIHESGHAVAAWLLGAQTVVAWPDPVPSLRASAAGLCYYTGVGDADDAVVALAGMAAERHLLGRVSAAGVYEDDLESAHGSAPTARAYTLAELKAAAIVVRHRSAIFALAARMTARGVVESNDLAEVTGCTPWMRKAARRITEAVSAAWREHHQQRSFP
jgi:hypothetical protein